MDFSSFDIANPKRYTDADDVAERKIFPYYAGYSSNFAVRLLGSMQLNKKKLLVDPWNGSGTTTSAARELGLNAIGFDLNPVMVVVGKAALLAEDELPSIEALAETIIDIVNARHSGTGNRSDPLSAWLAPSSANQLRRIEEEVNRSFISRREYSSLSTGRTLAALSPIAAFFYVALFRTARCLLRKFLSSNPTWVRLPQQLRERRRPPMSVIQETFLDQVNSLIDFFVDEIYGSSGSHKTPSILRADAGRLPLADASVHAVITSPPYCTRIDYAVATSIELAVLRFGEVEFRRLRRRLMGTSTVYPKAIKPDARWGNTCIQFLNALSAHTSKASLSYYYKNHAGYFASLYRAITEFSRVVRKGGACIIVAQDSHYKELLNDVPAIIGDMMCSSGFQLRRRQDFEATRLMTHVNTRARGYLQERRNVESVLCFGRT